MEGLKVTLVGMHHYNEEDFVFELNDSKYNKHAIELFLRRNPGFEHGIDVFAVVEGDFQKVGSLATNPGLVIDGTVNAKELSGLVDLDYLYPCQFMPNETAKIQGYGGRLELLLMPLSYVEGMTGIAKEPVKVLMNAFQYDTGIKTKGTRSFTELVHRYKMVNKTRVENEARAAAKEKAEAINSNGSLVKLNSTTTVTLTTNNVVTTTDGVYPNRITYDYVSNQTNTTPNNEKKGNIMKNMNSMFNKFGKDFAFPTSNFALSMFGGLAVRVNGNFVSYDTEKGEAMDVMDFVVDGFEDFIMIMPVQELKNGDVFVQDGKVYQMINAEERKAYNYNDNAIDTLVTKSNIMGFKMYAKVLNFASNMMGAGEKSDNMFANPMFMMMMMKDGDGDMGEMIKLMMMSQMFQSGFKIG